MTADTNTKIEVSGSPAEWRAAQRAHAANFARSDAGFQPTWDMCSSADKLRWLSVAKAALNRKPRQPRAPLPFVFYFNGRSIERVQYANTRTYKYGYRLVLHSGGSTSQVREAKLMPTAKAVARDQVRRAVSHLKDQHRDVRRAERGLIRAQRLLVGVAK